MTEKRLSEASLQRTLLYRHLRAEVGNFRIVSTDVFDTLLLRTCRAERTRILLGERRFSEQIAPLGYQLDVNESATARMAAQKMAFRATATQRIPTEVKIERIIARQLAILGLPSWLLPRRLALELEVEQQSLVANKPLANQLRLHKARGVEIIAVSDTTLSGQSVMTLIQHFYGCDLVSRVYCSADWGTTKRHGDLFKTVAREEGIKLSEMIHLGDDRVADFLVPARAKVRAFHSPRPN